ncbi:MAG: FAD-dependent oxidoreductase [Chloroflexi bacterium]|nr:FAD-dependent oxidoreductase [Chloroflexota bacterium]
MARVVVIGAGVGGCSAAITAAQAGVEVILLERSDTVSGIGPWTGQLMTWALRQEVKLTGGGAGQIVSLMESLAVHEMEEFGVPRGNISFDVAPLPQGMEKLVTAAGVKLMLRSRVVDVEMEGHRMAAVALADGRRIQGDVFVDATGKGGGWDVCQKYGQGCVLCILKCPTFGDRVAISERAGIPDEEVPGRVYFSCYMIYPGSLSPLVQQKVMETPGGYSYHPIPGTLMEHDFTSDWLNPQRPVTTRLTQDEFQVCHVGWAKTWLNIPLPYLRQVPGLEDAWLLTPLSAQGQTVQLNGSAPHDDSLQVSGIDNLFAAGLRSGRYSAFVEVMYTGDLAGHNAARYALGLKNLQLPQSTMMGFFTGVIKHGRCPTEWPPGPGVDPRFKERGFDTQDYATIQGRIQNAGLMGIYERRLT